MLIFVCIQVFYPKETFINPLILDLIFRQVDYLFSIYLHCISFSIDFVLSSFVYLLFMNKS